MNSLLVPIRVAMLCILASILAIATARGQQCQEGIFETQGQGLDAKSFAWSKYFTALSRLGTYYMPTFGDGDSMTETFWTGVDDQYHPYGAAGFQETWLVPRNDDPAGGGALFRMYNSLKQDHLDAPTSAPGSGYSVEFQEGTAYTTQVPGSLPVTRYFNGSIFDHKTWLNGSTPAGYALDAVYSSANGIPRYGYQRFGNCLSWYSVLNEQSCTVGCANAFVNSLANATARVDFNNVWGNAIGRITYLPASRQFVREDIGGMLQATIFLATSMDTPPVCCRVNPTEAGGVDGSWYGNTLRWVGSPVISATYSGLGTPVQTLTSVVKPLSFIHNLYATDSTDPAHPRTTDAVSPLLYKGLFRRTTSLGYTLGATSYTDVIKFRYEAQRDAASVGLATDNNNMTISGFYTMAVPFFEVLNLQTGSIQPGAARVNYAISGSTTDTKSAVITTIAGSTFSLGTFRKYQGSFPLALFSYAHDNRDNTVIVATSSFHGNLPVSPAWSSEDWYLVVGPTSTVEARLRQVYCQETAFCTPPTPPTTVTRRQVARELVQARGEEPVSPACSGSSVFADVPCSAPDWGWVQKIYLDGLSSGCGGGNFCPDTAVTNAQMAVLLAKGKYCPLNGSGSCPAGAVPSAPYPGWQDIANSPTDPYYAYLPYIDRGYADTAQIYQPGSRIWSGCSQSPLTFCPSAVTSSDDMITYLGRYWSN